MTYIDTFLNTITMYRLLMYGLGVLAGSAIILGFIGILPFSGLALLASLTLLVLLCYSVNVLCAALYRMPLNGESPVITALILFFLLEPSLTTVGLGWIAVGGIVAILSKYVFSFRNKHLFNPAAFSALLLALLGSGAVLWWVATPVLLLPVTILGVLIVRKIRRFHMVVPFMIGSLLVASVYAYLGGYLSYALFVQIATSWPLLFFAGVMLTEPATTPPTRNLRIVYAVLVGGLFSAQFSVGPLHATPELALIVGNVFSYIVSPKWKLKLFLQSIVDMGSGFYEFVFSAEHPFRFVPGQYMEWTVAHPGADGRGNRRYLTIASSPEEPYIRVATRIPNEHPSSFKQKLLAMKPGEAITAGALAGDFVLPDAVDEKLVYIAGGIGITPFISMLRTLETSGENRDIVLFYAVKTETDLVYKDVLARAEGRGVRIVHVVGAFITEEMVRQEVPDYTERTFYISGPNAMVETYRTLLRTMGVSGRKIKTDYFPGL